MSNRTVDALPPWFRVRHSGGVCKKGALKARSSEAMRAIQRAALDAIRCGSIDSDEALLPVRAREVSDRVRFD